MCFKKKKVLLLMYILYKTFVVSPKLTVLDMDNLTYELK